MPKPVGVSETVWKCQLARVLGFRFAVVAGTLTFPVLRRLITTGKEIYNMRFFLRMACFLIAISLVIAQDSGSTAATSPGPCAATEQKQLEFWVGEWDLTWPGEKQGTLDHGTNSIHRQLDSCVVQENFSGGTAMHLRGMSVSIFDTRSR